MARSRSIFPKPTMPSASAGAPTLASRTVRCWVTCATKSAITTGSSWCRPRRTGWRDSAISSATIGSTIKGPCSTTTTARPPTGRIASSACTRARIRGRTGQKRGRTTCTCPIRSRQRRPAACHFGPGIQTTRLWRGRLLDARKTRTPFDDLLEGWFPITYLLNNLNRGLGLADAYPFVLSATVVEKLRFVHETIAAQTSARLRRRTPQ